MRSSLFRTIFSSLFLTFAALPGCDSRPSPSPSIADPEIATESLYEAEAESWYQIQLEAEYGEEPYTWSLGNLPAGLDWLSIDPTTGVLSGRPPQSVDTAKEITVYVKDAQDHTTTKVFSLSVRPKYVAPCAADEVQDCKYISDDACFVSTRTCADGVFPVCTGGAASTSLDTCGNECGACADAPAHMTSSCTAGKCEYRCAADYGDCDGSVPGCETYLKGSDANNCGACGSTCTGSNFACQQGKCVCVSNCL
jgi:hypothetical protein